MNDEACGLGSWLRERCKEEKLTLRQAGAKTGLSHATIRCILNGGTVLPGTISKLARAFGSGDHHRLALEDELLVLAGYRTARARGEDLGETMAQLLDKLSQLTEPQLELVHHFIKFITRMGVK